MGKYSLIFVNYVMRICFFLVSLSIMASVLIKWSINYPHELVKNIGGIVLLTCLLGVIIYITRKMKGSTFILVLLVVTLILQVGWIIWSEVQPISDFSYMLNGAKHIANGNFAAVKADDYFFWYTTQLGYPLLEAFIIHFSSGSLLVLQFSNALFIVGTIYLLYTIGNICVNEQAGKITALLYASYIGLFTLVPVLTNQHSSAFFIFLGLRLLLHPQFKRTIWMKMLVGLFLALGNILYPIGVLFILSIFFYIIFYFKVDKQKFELIQKIKSLVLIVGTYSLTIFLFSTVLMNLGISNHGIQHYDNNWKFVLGLNQETNGQYSLGDFNELLPAYLARDEKKHAEIEIQLIKERLENPKQVVELMKAKSIYMWGMPSDSYKYAAIYPVDLAEEKALKVPYIRLENIQYAVICLFMLITSIGLLATAHKLMDNELNLYTIFMIGGFLIYLIIEIQIRYRYFFIPIMCLLASYSFSWGMNRFGKKCTT